jgi:hypothetical protein
MTGADSAVYAAYYLSNALYQKVPLHSIGLHLYLLAIRVTCNLLLCLLLLS